MHQAYGDQYTNVWYLVYTLWFTCSQTDFKVLGFLIFWLWPTCWRLFRQRVKRTKFNIYGFIGRSGVKHLDHNLSINCLIVDDDTSTRRPDLMSNVTNVYTDLISLVSDALCAVCGKITERKCPKLCITDWFQLKFTYLFNGYMYT